MEKKQIKINKKKILRCAAKVISGICVTGVTTMVIRSNAIPTNTKEKIMLAVGSFVIGDMVASRAEKHIDETFDRIENELDSIKFVKEEN